jgi:hypothetical protein
MSMPKTMKEWGISLAPSSRLADRARPSVPPTAMIWNISRPEGVPKSRLSRKLTNHSDRLKVGDLLGLLDACGFSFKEVHRGSGCVG